MSLGTGQLLRLGGMLVETACVVGVLAARQGRVGFWERTGLDPSLVLGTGFVVGFALWAVGTYTIHRHRAGGRAGVRSGGLD